MAATSFQNPGHLVCALPADYFFVPHGERHMSPTLLTAICMAHEMSGLCPEPRTSDSTLRLTNGNLELSEWPSDHQGSRCFGFLIRRRGQRDWQVSYEMSPQEPVSHALNRLVSMVRTFTRDE